MAKTYLVTLHQVELQELIFSCVNNAITLNKISDKDYLEELVFSAVARAFDGERDATKKTVSAKSNKANG